METTKQTVEMTAQEAAEYQEFQKSKAAAAAKQKAKDDRAAYADLVNETIAMAMPTLECMSQQIATTKATVLENFQAVLDMKGELFGVKEGQQSHTFTNADSTMRITIGHNAVDDYRDTVNEGIAMVQNYIQSLATTPETQTLVKAVMRLLSKDQKGTLKASRVLALRKMAEDSNDEKFIEGVRIIEEAYQPTLTRRYIRAEVKDANNGWKSIPLGVTEA